MTSPGVFRLQELFIVGRLVKGGVKKGAIEMLRIQDLQHLEAQIQMVHLDEKRRAQDLQWRLCVYPGLFNRHVPQAYQMLRKLLDVHNLCEPIEVNGKPGYRFTAVGTFDRRLTGKMAMDNPANVFGGGQGNPLWLPVYAPL